MPGKIFNFQRYAIHDGPGIRSVVFLSGCPLRCQWCCNPESFVSNGGFTREVELDEIMEQILEDRPYFKNSGGGVTLSGGEPLLQIEFVKSLLEECKKAAIGTALDTCGDVPWSNFEAVKGLVDHYLYDIKSLNKDGHKRTTGRDNARILDNLKRLSKGKERIYLRVPLIPDYNLSEKEATDIGQLASRVSAQEVHLLPYHRLGENKYLKLKTQYLLAGKKDLMSYKKGVKAVEDFANIARSYTKDVFIGG